MVTLKKFENGFEYLEVTNLNATAKIALQGAHIFSYKRSKADELLWISSRSEFQKGSAIRGGIPLCWPRFGNLDTTLPQHGFARTAAFEFVKVDETSEGETKVHLLLKSSAETRKIWDYAFTLEVVFTISDTLEIAMITTNKDTKEFLITEAFHTYFQVSHINDVVIKGLEGKPYLDTLIDEKKVQEDKVIIDAEVDRIYLDTTMPIILRDKGKDIKIETKNSASVIVWNPWIEKCKNMSAMDVEGYKNFVCIESANALDDYKIIEPNATYTLKVAYSVNSMEF
jgi:glucose-6-phosphate 1-epimerase